LFLGVSGFEYEVVLAAGVLDLVDEGVVLDLEASFWCDPAVFWVIVVKAVSIVH